MQNSEQHTAQNPDPSLALAEAFDASAAAADFLCGAVADPLQLPFPRAQQQIRQQSLLLCRQQ